MKFYLIATISLLALIGFEFAASVSLSNSQAWRLYKQQHGKVYASPQEEAMRFAIFMANKEQVERHNAQNSATFQLALNHMSDWTADEFKRMNGYRSARASGQIEGTATSSDNDELLRKYLESDAPLPVEVDWRKVPERVSEVKNQGHCGSCWAFATTGLLEGQEVAHKFTKKLTTLSEQQLLDCSDLDLGCEGGDVSMALMDTAKIGGIESEADYPYRAANASCSFAKSKSVMSTLGEHFLNQRDESLLEQMVATYGPVAVAIDATKLLQHYKSGILSDPTCAKESRMLNHAVLVVGYGVDPKAGKYWIVKNSWGKDWGDEGYFKYVRGVNMCGIATEPVVALF